MRDVTQYFDLVTKLIELSPAVDTELDLEQFDYKRGMIEGTLYFADGSRLEFSASQAHWAQNDFSNRAAAKRGITGSR